MPILEEGRHNGTVLSTVYFMKVFFSIVSHGYFICYRNKQLLVRVQKSNV